MRHRNQRGNCTGLADVRYLRVTIWPMPRLPRRLFNGLAFLSMLLCAGVPYFATSDRTTYSSVWLTASPENFAETFPHHSVSINLINGRSGHYVVERPGPHYGELRVRTARGSIPLAGAIAALAALPAAWVASYAYRRGKLFLLVSILSMTACCAVLAWRTLGDPFMYPDMAAAFSGPVNPFHPPRWPTHQSYTLPLGGQEYLPWQDAAMQTLLIPIAYFSWIGYRRYQKNKRAANGLCRSCKYDLTGNASGICPECGTPITLTK